MNKSSTQMRGLIHVYSGPGKGKTTASLGLALRACGHGWKVKMICFMKGDPSYGEVLIAPKIPNFELVQSGLPTFVKKGDPSLEDVRLAREGFDLARNAVKDDSLDLLILDEINVAVDYGLLDLNDLVDFVEKKPRRLELVLTGRYAHPEVVKRADLVSEILEIKHPYQEGILSREGIDF
ncbi:MAG: cob(I)yrinic acid a,c-diamide adenosyltransferase [bacterium]